ncbi:tandem-95 repeat protein, partial [bacterium]|nr:tandem-95 repeat protein [bacterium]
MNAFDGQFRDGIPNVTDGTFPVWVSSSAFDRPLAREINQTTNEDTPVVISLLGQGVPGASLTYTASNPINGSIQIDGSNLTFTPALHFLGVETFTYQTWANGIASTPATIRVTVIAGNDAPIANNQSLNLDEDTNVSGVLVASDMDNDPLTYTITAQPSHGLLSGTLPNFIYTPNPNYSGPDSFSFKANDTHVDSNVATVSLTILPVNDVPLADSKELTTPMDVSIPVTLSGFDVENAPLTFSVMSNPVNGSLSGTAPNLTYTPNNGFVGTDSFTYTAFDSLATSLEATVTIQVTAGNQAPVANDQTVGTNEDSDLVLTLTGSDPEAQPIAFTVLSQPVHGSLIGSAPSFTYRPNANFNGSDSFTFKVNDGQSDSNVASVSIMVNSVNDAPLANNLSINTTVNQAAGIVLSGLDIENSPLAFI